MDVGMTLPMRGPLANPSDVRTLVEQAEALGFDHIGVNDHIVVPKAIGSRYPYSATGAFPGSESGECLDLFTLLAYVAAITTKPRLVTAITVAPHRGAVHTAKIVSSIDVLSGGRMVLGVGAGWMKEEFDALNIPPFELRGKVTAEYLQVFKTLWTEDEPRFDGEYVQFDNISFLPKPVQKPHPPIWVGGESKAAMRRTIRHGDTWFPIANNPHHPSTASSVSRRASGGCNAWPRKRAVTQRASASPSSPTGTTKPRPARPTAASVSSSQAAPRTSPKTSRHSKN